jgi:hypothetical protein
MFCLFCLIFIFLVFMKILFLEGGRKEWPCGGRAVDVRGGVCD